MKLSAGDFDVNLCNFYFAGGTLIYSVVQAIIEARSLVFLFDNQFWLLVVSGLFGWLLQGCLVTSLKYDSPSNVQLVSSVGIVYALIGDYFFFGEAITAPTFLGVAILMGSLIKLTRIRR